MKKIQIAIKYANNESAIPSHTKKFIKEVMKDICNKKFTKLLKILHGGVHG